MVVFEMSDKKNQIIGRRLRLLRQVKGYRHANAFAAFLGIPPSRWNNLERGYPLSKDIALLLCRRVSGVSLDWLYFGKTDGLSVKLEEKLAGLVEEPPTPSRRNTTTS